MVAENFERMIKQVVNDTLSRKNMAPDTELLQTDNLAEVLEKLIIVHIRMWMLEDAAGEARKDSDLADIKRKIDLCFKVKRPKYVEAINRMVDDAITNKNSLQEESVKIYKGVS